MNGNVNYRDAVILGIRAGNNPPEMVWRTAYGGTASERGWGIAGSLAQPSDIYLVGGVASQPFQLFPLHEFSTSSTLDYYQPLNLSGVGASGSLNSWYRFEYGLDFENGTLGFATPEATHQGHDGFIASFAAYHPVGIGEHAGSDAANGLLVTPLPAYGQWAVHFPNAGEWKLMAFNAAGQVVGNWHSQGAPAVVDLSEKAAGMYLLRAVTLTGERRSAKVVRP